MNLTLMWPPEMVITESMFRHFSGLTEVAGYLNNISEVVKNSGLCVKVYDCAVTTTTALNIVSIARESRVIAIYVNMNNIHEAHNLTSFIKSVNRESTIIVYGEAVSCNPLLFSKIPEVDYVVGNGQVEYGIEYIIVRELGSHLERYLDNITIERDKEGKIITIGSLLPESRWGMTDFSISPIDEYLDLSQGELHLLINKGCPFHCKFCNERLVSSNKVHYRMVEQVVDFLCAEYSKKVKSVYLDASTFTYNREWVVELCEKLNERKSYLPWKTCTRLDCLDEELVRIMSMAGCARISIGVESFDVQIQMDNKKIVEKEKLVSFSKWCHQYGIQPRALLIIGLKGQKKEDIYEALEFCRSNGIDARFRVLQDYSALIECNNIDELDFHRLDRWNTWNPFENMDINELRKIEYPAYKMGKQNYV